MVSEFLCAAIGRLSYYDDDCRKCVYATEVIKYGSGTSDDGWWNAERMVEQTRKTIRIFNRAFPNDIAVFAFDNSSGHACKAADALVARRMNLSPAGKQPLMHDTVFRGQDGQLHPQTMTFRQGDMLWDSNIPIPEEYVNKSKGMKQVLQERGLL